jgi:hypothetical protein
MNATTATEHEPGVWLLTEEETKAVSGGLWGVLVAIALALLPGCDVTCVKVDNRNTGNSQNPGAGGSSGAGGAGGAGGSSGAGGADGGSGHG